LPKERKTLAVSKDLADRLIAQTKEKGITLYNFLNNSMKQVIRAENELNESINVVMETIESYNLAKKLGFFLTSADLYHNSLTDISEEKETYEKKFFDFGLWIIRYLEIKYQNIDTQLTKIRLLTKHIFPNELQLDFKFGKEGSHSIKIIKKSMDYSNDVISYYSHMLIAMFEYLGFEKIKHLVEKSHTHLEFIPKSDEVKMIFQRLHTNVQKYFITDKEEKQKFRKTLAVEKEVAEELLEIAQRKNMTLYNYVNEMILKNCLKIYEDFDKNLEEIVNEFMYLQVIKELDLILVPSSIYYESVQNNLKKDENYGEQWYDDGKRHGKIIISRFSDFPTEYFKNLINEIFFTDVSGFKIQILQEVDLLTFSIIGTMINYELMTCISYYYEGLFSEFGYYLDEDSKIISLGVCSLKFRRRKKGRKR